MHYAIVYAILLLLGAGLRPDEKRKWVGQHFFRLLLILHVAVPGIAFMMGGKPIWLTVEGATLAFDITARLWRVSHGCWFWEYARDIHRPGSHPYWSWVAYKGGFFYTTKTERTTQRHAHNR